MAGTRRRKALYVAARHGISGRGQLIHRVADEGSARTACGATLERWSLEYTRTPIEMLLCRRAACRAATHTAANRTTEPGAIVILADRRRARRAS